MPSELGQEVSLSMLEYLRIQTSQKRHKQVKLSAVQNIEAQILVGWSPKAKHLLGKGKTIHAP